MSMLLDHFQARAMQLFDELRQWRKIRPTHLPTVHVVSSKTGAGIAELRSSIAEAACLKLKYDD